MHRSNHLHVFLGKLKKEAVYKRKKEIPTYVFPTAKKSFIQAVQKENCKQTV